MMDRAAALVKLQSLFESDLEIVERNVIFRDQDRYSVFGMYDIETLPDHVTVTRQQETVAEFCDLRSAMSWCIAKKYQQAELADNIVKLDREHNRLQQDIDFDRELLNRIKDRDRRFVVSTKIDHHRGRLGQIKDRLSKCISRAKYCQIRGFNDEIARTRRPAPHKPSRPSARKPSGPKH
jgi:hypothetical protein